MRILLEEFCPGTRGRIVEIDDRVRLRQATGANLVGRVATIAQKAKARAVREDAELACVFVHEDLDGLDGDVYPQTRERVQKALEAGLGNAHYVLAVWEIEAWLLLFPDAIHDHVASWQIPVKYQGRDTGKLADPKSILMREVSGPARRYRESDAPSVLANAVALGCHQTPVGSNRSWNRLHEDIALCCNDHLRAVKG